MPTSRYAVRARHPSQLSPGQLCCPSCGAPAGDVRQSRCEYCTTPLGTRACPSCFSRLATGVTYCPWCGDGVVTPNYTHSDLPCPCGETTLSFRHVPLDASHAGHSLALADCDACEGLWVGRETVERLVAAHADDTMLLALVPGLAATASRQSREVVRFDQVRYRACPECRTMMNRVNFSRISGIIVDVCKEHGTWFDAHEFPAMLEFVRQGGLDTARARESAALVDERRRLERERMMRTPMEMAREQRGALAHSTEHTPLSGFFTLLGELLIR